jgi:hypothetical protein
MRFGLVRGWAVIGTAILAAAVADAGTEFAENSGWLGGTLRDNQHESILPTLILGAAVTLALTFFILLARISSRDPLLLRMNELRTQVVDIVFAFCAGMLCVVGMEGSETRFGGLSPFDPRSVVLSHTLALAVAVLIVGTIVQYVLRSAIGVASRAGGVVAELLVAFLRKRRRADSSPRIVKLSAFQLHVPHVLPGISGGSRGFRAPPRSIRPLIFVA